MFTSAAIIEIICCVEINIGHCKIKRSQKLIKINVKAKNIFKLIHIKYYLPIGIYRFKGLKS